MEDETQPSRTDPREALKPVGGRDELNLAEFPITLLSDRVPKDCKTLVFEIEPRGEGVPRKVTITGSDYLGLPTAVDDEVLVALIQLTKLKNDFTSRTVPFSRYEVVKLLGWPDNGNSYDRVEEAINRWAGVTLYYDNAWKKLETKEWVSETFHVIERASFLPQEARRTRLAKGQHELAFSTFTWNEVMFQSFQAGSLKRLDIDAYFSFTTSIAKRMYRFLDKRFWVKPRWEFDLKEFAFERIGLSRKYNVAQIKNKLQPAIEELSQATKERAAFLEEMPSEARYVKVGKGQWLIILARKMSDSLPNQVEVPHVEPSGLVAELVARGVDRDVAAELVRTSPADLVTLRLEVFDWLLQRKNQKIITENPTGYLVSSIKDKYLSVPKGFESMADREKREAAKEAERRKELHDARQRHAANTRERELSERVTARWEAMTAAEREELEAAALADADEATRQQYQATTPRMQGFLMTGIRLSYLRKLIEAEAAPH
jgi:hypothetical protein